MKLLEVKDLAVRYGDVTVVENVNFSVEEGQWLMLIGPNGAGKSTAVKAISQEVAYSGAVYYKGRDVKTYKSWELAQNLGVLAQHNSVGYNFTVGEVVRLGRYSYAPGIFSKKTDADDTKVEQAMALTGVKEMEHQSVLTLSGGELQRTFLAQLLAQDPKILILDEPTNHLDLVYQKQIFALIQDWLKGEGRAVISVVHDLSLARTYGTHAMLLDKAAPLAYGKIGEVFTPENLNKAYRMDVGQWMLDMLTQWQ